MGIKAIDPRPEGESKTMKQKQCAVCNRKLGSYDFYAEDHRASAGELRHKPICEDCEKILKQQKV